jgi:hypothetical protein
MSIRRLGTFVTKTYNPATDYEDLGFVGQDGILRRVVNPPGDLSCWQRPIDNRPQIGNRPHSNATPEAMYGTGNLTRTGLEFNG